MGDKQSYGRIAIRTTDEYGKFQFHQHNRVLRDADGGMAVRKDLFESMSREGYRVEEPITAYRNSDGTLTVIDGHNRLVAAQALGIPVHYIAYSRNGIGEWTPVKHSAGQRGWKMRDYIHAYAADGFADYGELLEFCDRTGIAPKQASSMLMGQHANSSNSAPLIKDGRFRITDRKTAEIVADIVGTAQSFIAWPKSPHFVAALSGALFVSEFSADRMKDNICKHHEQLAKPKNLQDAYQNVEHVYNFRRKDRLYLTQKIADVLKSRAVAWPKNR